MGPPREHGGMASTILHREGDDLASMGPPREHGGMLRQAEPSGLRQGASMGPPREHGGMVHVAAEHVRDQIIASMGPPREHGGMLHRHGLVSLCVEQLQWGRRVNTAEWSLATVGARSSRGCFNGAAA